ncbi:MAG TPA: winged helix-turn-helix domain-containing protein [Amaricoccus sp.]|nr:winged helix-turn-helix domain-containing protein [Amaricoccus sp.]
MIYGFGGFELDTLQFRLMRGGAPVPVEPLVFDLLRLFVENAGAVVDRDRMIAAVWDGRIVSEATLSTAVKSARRALGDSGAEQAWIETVRGRGFRFCGAVTVTIPPRATVAAPPPAAVAIPLRTAGSEEPAIGAEAEAAPSIAVLPFERIGDPAGAPGLEDALAHEIIVALARLRSLFVIARGSSFQFRGAAADVGAVGRRLGVRYCLTGAVELVLRRLAVTVELADTATGRVVWADRFERPLDDVQAVRGEIVRIVAVTLEARIQSAEALRAQGRPAENLDAWSAFHLGLAQMHLYTGAGNVAAEGLFRRAVALEPGLARAHAGLAFVHFQNAFLHHVPDRPGEIRAARRAGERGLELDPLDPFVNFNVGRSCWLEGDLAAAMPWFDRATEISPNYAQGHYVRGLVDALCGQHARAEAEADAAIGLSPLDPLLYAMRATKALARIGNGDFAAAARYAEAAARTPRAHVVIAMIAAASNALAGDERAARRWTATARQASPTADCAYFLEALPAADPETRRRLTEGLRRSGF